MNLSVIFLTGFTVGGLTCLAVQGGLLATVITARESESTTNAKYHALFTTMVFLLAKLIAHVLLGFLLGAFGSVVNIGGNIQTFMQLFAGAYMIAVAMNLLNIHPVFRYVIIQPPRFLTRIVRNQSRSRDIFAPAILGAMTIFIPCGTTLAMEALSVSTANAWLGGAIMLAFILGTMPLFLGIGWMTSVLGEAFKAKFLKLTAVVVLYLGINSVNGAFIALNFPLNSVVLTDIFQMLRNPPNNSYNDVGTNVSQDYEILVTSNGYAPNYVRVKRGLPVTLTIISKDAYSCASAFRIPALKISKNLQPNEVYTLTFTPEKEGKIQFNCSMGMYRGVIEVI